MMIVGFMFRRMIHKYLCIYMHIFLCTQMYKYMYIYFVRMWFFAMIIIFIPMGIARFGELSFSNK